MTDHTPPEYILVEQDTDLQRLMAELRGEPVIGVDLEADSMFHYQEKVCLIQIATRRLNLLIDPLSVRDLSPLAPIFADRRIRKVFHGADYDIRSLYRDFGIEVHSLFDTQIAARFLGSREISLASLLHENFHISSDKKYQKKDWSQRPLPVPMMAYAVQDICYLLPLARILEDKLKEKGLLFCVKEECDLLSAVRPNSPRSGPFFTSFKGAARLDPRSLAILENILQLRDELARRRDCPHFKVLGNQPILDIVQNRPLSKSDLSDIKGLSRKQIDHMGEALIEKVREGLHVPDEALPVYPRKIWQRLRSREGARVEVLKSWRDRVGDQWGVDPAVICTNAQIREIAISNPRRPQDMKAIEEIRNWQIELLGPEICNLLKETG
ncbi:MAG: HRDC domain-containing protein [Deltaproteobacteria bacterium]|nr:HRDC domain-containing protein [Deltaproteobacteria bacterium]